MATLTAELVAALQRAVLLSAPSDDGGFPTTWVNQDGASIDTSNGGTYLTIPAGTPPVLHARVKAALTAPYTVTISFVAQIPDVNAASGFDFGFILRDSVGEKVAILYLYCASTPSLNALISHFTDMTHSDTYGSSIISLQPGLNWLQLRDDGVNRILAVSFDGIHFHDVVSEANDAYMVPDQIGVFAGWEDTGGVPGSVWLLSWEEA